ncbi:MAG: hypothetical protein FD123_3682 [Bacteroidetes bacterium]|nr:MAG: hypothetical protein FD123_3682 [Bacteroidota bacterium]
MKTTKRYLLITSGVLFSILATAFTFLLPPEMKFEELKHNFGFIRQGEIVSHEFTFTNNGDEPLLITNAEVQCVCTTVDFPKQPVMKGQKAVVKITFDTKSAIDRQERTVTLTSNAKNSPTVLTFKAVVLKKKE